MLRYSRVTSSALEIIIIIIIIKKTNTQNKMDKRKLRVVLTVLEAVKTQYPDTKQFIEDLIDKECQKEKISVEEVIFLQA